MRFLCFLLFTTCVVSGLKHGELRARLQEPHIRQQLNYFEKVWKQTQNIAPLMNLGDISVECGVCGIAINEVEGFVGKMRI